MTTLNRFLLEFLKTEAGSGFLLAACAAVALVWANLPAAHIYEGFVRAGLPGPWGHDWPLAEWVKEGLMAVFFYMVGLEIKHEIRDGALSDPKTLALPVGAALGGMIVPALVYLGVNASGGDPRGWSIPVATDIAFALAVLSMAGKALPASLRVFLLTLAIVDDLGAVVIIGVFYNSAFSLAWIGGLLAVFAVTFAVRFIPRIGRAGRNLIYLVLFALAWWVTLKAGISPSLTAVISAFCVSTRRLQGLIHTVHPFVAYLVLPLFAFTASGFSLAGAGAALFADPRFLGVALGLFAGKQLGVYAAARGLVFARMAVLPQGATPLQLYGVCLLCGIGFTMSLYLAALAFPAGDKTAEIAAKSAIAVASLLSACAGAAILNLSQRTQKIHV
ncbi:Na+/H+ antiporter NhaA [Asticcacaulis solisilvae]|uniref:Na+/H+ antiporter NhaA n=1 Tax=Asticcacaulis solisilvae TaxID=1217274 RepID=UPI003FD7B1EA